MRFVHLHIHSHYSLLDGLTKIDELIEFVKNDDGEAVALTDHGVMYGAIEFYQKCKKGGIKPIIGIETYLASGSRHEKTLKSDEKNYYHLILLAKNNIGYKNLIKLTSLAHLEGYYYKPRIDWEILKQYKEGLIASTACLAGEIPRLILAGKIEKAKARIREYKELFGEGNFYLELMPHWNLEGQREVNNKLIEFSREFDIPLIATNDVHYLRKEDDEAQDILLCLQNKRKLEDADRMNMTGNNYSLKSAKEMMEEFKDVPEAIANTVKISEMCNLEIELGKIQLPFFPVPENFDGNSYLRKLCLDAFLKRYSFTYENANSEIKERLDFELSVIAKMGWPSYFLIVADFVNWAKNNGIVVGPGRGSAAGSIVCYLTGITNLDPLKYNLLFERFLNPDRISMPDIDLDFADDRRDEVIKYVEKKYGHDHVAQIITFGTMAARAAVRDVGRVLSYPYEFCDKLAKLIPMSTKIDEAVKNEKELKDLVNSDPAAQRIINYAKKLEGVARHASVHACGILITKDPLTENVPVQYVSSSDRSIVSQFSLHPIEDLGLLKMDFLGLKNLTIIESAVNIIKNTRGLVIDIEKIPLNDEKTYKLFQAGETTGVFQFESSGMKRYLRELVPNEFEDIIAMVALYRPGPMDWIVDYISGKHGKKKPNYLHPKLEPILKKTYGVAIYQEQVMQMARDLAGFTMAEADVLRKAVGKKIPKLLAEQKQKFIDGCVKNSIPSQLAENIFSFIEPFAGYGFNRSHAACYALIGYQTAYLKAHWPTEFMAALLTSDQEDIDRIAIEIEECRNMNIKVMQPDVNQSFYSFTVVTSGTEKNEIAKADEKVHTIRFGLKAIKNIGGHISEVIIKERKENGKYKSLADLLQRIIDKDLNKKSLESLIKSGALDQFNDRGQMLVNLENLLKYNKEISDRKDRRQNTLFGNITGSSDDLRLAPAPKVDRQEKLSWEKELLGLYISDHPFIDYKKYLSDMSVVSLRNLSLELKNTYITISGIISTIKKITTGSGEPMLFVKIEDNTNNTEILVFPKLYKETASVWLVSKAILCYGRVSDKELEVKILATAVEELNLSTIEVNKENFRKKLIIAEKSNFWRNKNKENNQPASNKTENTIKPLKIVLQKEASQDILNNLKEILLKNTGQSKVYFKISNGGKDNIIETGFSVKNSPALTKMINDTFKGIVSVIE